MKILRKKKTTQRKAPDVYLSPLDGGSHGKGGLILVSAHNDRSSQGSRFPEEARKSAQSTVQAALGKEEIPLQREVTLSETHVAGRLQYLANRRDGGVSLESISLVDNSAHSLSDLQVAVKWRAHALRWKARAEQAEATVAAQEAELEKLRGKRDPNTGRFIPK